MASIEKVIQELLTKRKKGGTFSNSDFPSDMYLPSGIYSVLQQLSGYTTPKKGLFSFGKKQKTQGSSGNEFAVQFIYFIDTLYAGPNTRGDSSSVSISDKVSVKPIQEGESVKFSLKIGSKEKITKKYNVADVSDPLFGSGISFHTHPKQYLQDGSGIYGFFSPRDIGSLLGGSSPLLGLVVGNYLWIAAKTAESKMIPPEKLQMATRIEYESKGYDQVKSYIRENLKEYGIVFYFGTLTGKLIKI